MTNVYQVRVTSIVEELYEVEAATQDDASAAWRQGRCLEQDPRSARVVGVELVDDQQE